MNQKKRVLIIDDDQDLLEMYGQKFAGAGFTVEKAENGAWGMKRIKEDKFDLVLLDMAMPAMNGLEMLKAIQEEKKSKGYPKIMALSNTALDFEIKAMQESGADKCFIKIKVTPAEICEEALELLKIENQKS